MGETTEQMLSRMLKDSNEENGRLKETIKQMKKAFSVICELIGDHETVPGGVIDRIRIIAEQWANSESADLDSSEAWPV